jgi:hypothetical protein
LFLPVTERPQAAIYGLRNKSGSLAIFAAIRRASCFERSLLHPRACHGGGRQRGVGECSDQTIQNIATTTKTRI